MTSGTPAQVGSLPHEMVAWKAAAEDLAAQRDRLTAELQQCRQALAPLAGIPLEEFGWERSPDQPITGWNKHTLYVRDALAARAALKERT